jgi:hypothetical protein
MSSKRRLVKAIKILSKRFSKFSNKYLTAINKLINWLLRTLFITRRRRESANAGFVLPTVAMVALVVVLLTTAILFRSFDRSKNASNVRVNETVLKATSPAIDRAKAKINALLEDPSLPRSTPTDISLYNALTGKLKKYTFDDETQLQVAYDINGNNSIELTGTTPALEDDEVSRTAWRFPVDTDNDGSYDTFTLYGIYFRSPSRDNSKKSENKDNYDFNRARSPLEARTPPMDDGSISDKCSQAVGSNLLVGSSDWYKSGSKIKKSFFVYATNVPITDAEAATLGSPYKAYKGNKGFAAIEYQQDQVRIPLSNNAVVYEDDLEITPGTGLILNGRIMTNANLLVGKQDKGLDIRFYQVSSQGSCFYKEENSKIIVGGNVVVGKPDSADSLKGIGLDLYNPGNKPAENQTLDSTNQSVTNAGNATAYNSEEYSKRINQLVNKWVSTNVADSTGYNTNDPSLVIDKVIATTDPTLKEKERLKAIENYFKERTRRVPFAEPIIDSKTLAAISPLGSKDKLRPPFAWMNPSETNTKITLKSSAKNLLPKATEPTKQQDKKKLGGKEQFIGDRILLGNNLPAKWCQDETSCGDGKFISADEDTQKIGDFEWDDFDDELKKIRTRQTRITPLSDLGDTSRDGFWEQQAKEIPKRIYDNVGGLRIVTGAGVYLPDNNSIDTSTDASTVVWSDTMPVVTVSLFDKQATPKRRPFLKMRATAVYHYKYEDGEKPIACVSSYYDPTDTSTSLNTTTFAGKTLSWNINREGKSNNGITYTAPTSTYASVQAQLAYQAKLFYPNGRRVNDLLKKAVDKNGVNLTPAEQSAVDSTICAIDILKGNISPNTTPTAGFKLPDGIIYEKSFLDARQVKVIDKDYNPQDKLETAQASLTGKYDFDIEQRQPLEVRVTLVDLKQLRDISTLGTVSTSPGNEYLFPNSGIIYATRDDALPDLSAPKPATGKEEEKEKAQKRESAVDYKLDPTRRPNGIMLINGQSLGRETKFREEEKGMILASNLPVYIQGDPDNRFNHHTSEEFTKLLVDKDGNIDWSKFYDRKQDQLDKNFACRKDDPRIDCPSGDNWRPATVIGDAITLVSSNFQPGVRSEGDYDLRNNETDNVTDPNGDGFNDLDSASTIRDNRLKAGFWNNNFVTTRDFTDSDYSGNTALAVNKNSSYFNNFVTPIQRRANVPEYVMEVCKKKLVSDCKPDDWVVVTAGGDIKASELALGTTPVINLLSGTTAKAATKLEDRVFPRRVAFLRYPSGTDANKLVLDSNKAPIPLGIYTGVVDCYSYKAGFQINVDSGKKFTGAGTNYTCKNTVPELANNALWYRGTNNLTNPTDNAKFNYGNDKPLSYLTALTENTPGGGTTDQPLLMPVLQIHLPTMTPTNKSTLAELIKDGNNKVVVNTNWMQKPIATRFNLVAVAGDTPSRNGESNGGLHNFIRFLESWSKDSNNNNRIPVTISGSFIQSKHSAYATAPFQMLLGTSATTGGIFNYPQAYKTGVEKLSDSASTLGEVGKAPYYEAPDRQWGYDVGLLSQIPDLFAQRFTSPSAGKPNEFYREVAQDDPWVHNLLCAVKNTDDKPAKPAISSQRPQDCPNL